MFRAILLALLWIGSSTPAGAQTGAATVQGIVRDTSGAVVPGAKVRLTHQATAQDFYSASNETGRYTLPALPIGVYRLKVEASGLKTWEADVLLTVNQTAGIETVLEVATSATSITVAGDVSSVVTDSSAAIGSTLERSRIDQLPMNGRNFVSLAAMTMPAIEMVAGSPRAWGLRDAAFEVVQDGAVLTNRDQGQVSYMPPSIEVIAEFKVETNNSSAKLNRPATGIVTTRSGTNLPHGALFEVLRDNYIGQARARQDLWSVPPKFIRNQFGFNTGGPVLVPKVYDGRNKTFFFVVSEWYRERGGATVRANVPLAKWRQGDFSGLTDSQGRALALYDPWSTAANWSRTPYVNNVLPAARMSPLAKYLYGITPLPNADVNPLSSANFFGPGYNRSDRNQMSARIDHRFSDTDQTFFRVQRNGWVTEDPTGQTVYPTLGKESNMRNFIVTNYAGVANWVHTFSPRFFSETLFNYNYEGFDVYFGAGDGDWSTKLGLPNPFGTPGFPEVRNVGLSYEWWASRRRNNRTGILNLDQNMTFVAGKHSLEFGGRFRKDRIHVLYDQQPATLAYFDSLATALYDPAGGANPTARPQTGFDQANLFLGVGSSYSAYFNSKMLYLREFEVDGYLQDNWKLTSRLTLNLGLRYELHPTMTEHDDVLPGFSFDKRAVVYGPAPEDLIRLGRTTQSIVNQYTQYGVKFLSAQQAGSPEHVFRNTGLGLQPRFGFAWRASGGRRPLVVRGGYGLYTYPISTRNWDASTTGILPNQARFMNSAIDPAYSPDGLRNYSLRSVPTIIAGQNSAGVIDVNKPTSVARGAYPVFAFATEQPILRVHQVNFTLEREMLANTLARVAWVGSFGRNLEQFRSYNRAPISDYVYYTQSRDLRPTGEFANVALRSWDKTTYGDISMFQRTGFSNLGGLQLELQRRYAKGYAFQIFYVLQNALRVAGNGSRDDQIPDPASYLPGAVPTDIDALNRFYSYRRDDSIPKQRVNYNFLVDLPVGRGKLLARSAPGWLDKAIGGWQVAGIGSMRSRYFSPSLNYWGALGDIELYGKKHPIEDCRSGTCYPGYLWANIFIPPSQINSVNAQGKPNGIMGVPADYKPAAAYVDNVALNNFVNIPLKNGTTQRVNLDTGLHPWRNQFLPGPWLRNLDASLFKRVTIRERVQARFNVDFFNVLNSPGQPMPDGNGIALRNANANAARQLQLTLRLEW